MKRFIIAALLLGTPAMAEDATPPVCCTLHVSPEAVNVIHSALDNAPIAGAVTRPIMNDIAAQVQAELKAKQDYDAAHAPKPSK